MTTLVGISGSLRQKSFNTAILNAAAELAPEGVTIAIHTIRGIPLYDADVEKAEGIPAQVSALKDAIAACDGLLVATPEYNNGMPGVLKNAIDWLTRPTSDIGRVFGGRPVAMIGASPGGFGTILSQNSWLPVWKVLGVQLWSEQRLLVSRAATLMDPEGALADEKTREQIAKFVAGFAAYAKGSSSRAKAQ
jgi:chromate reductase